MKVTVRAALAVALGIALLGCSNAPANHAPSPTGSTGAFAADWHIHNQQAYTVEVDAPNSSPTVVGPCADRFVQLTTSPAALRVRRQDTGATLPERTSEPFPVANAMYLNIITGGVTIETAMGSAIPFSTDCEAWLTHHRQSTP